MSREKNFVAVRRRAGDARMLQGSATERRLERAYEVQLESRRLFLRLLWGRAEVVPAAGKAGAEQPLLAGCAYSG